MHMPMAHWYNNSMTLKWNKALYYILRSLYSKAVSSVFPLYTCHNIPENMKGTIMIFIQHHSNLIHYMTVTNLA